MKSLIAAFAIAVLAAAAPAHADEAAGLTLGLRAAYGLPLGDAGDGANLRGLTTGAIPMQLEAGWRFDEHWFAGAFFSWGPTYAGSDARDLLRAQGLNDVSGHAVQRLGLQGIYTILPEQRFAPWVGLSVGYEWALYADAKLSDGREIEVGLGGFEAAVQVGGDYRLTPNFSIGPFATFNVGQYRSHLTWIEHSENTTASVEDRGIHGWLQVGLKGTFNL
jgi:hypothetical protein